MQFFNYVMRKGIHFFLRLLCVSHVCRGTSTGNLLYANHVCLTRPLTVGEFCSEHLVWLHQTRIGLSLYDVAGQGYLRESVRIHFSSVVKKFFLPLAAGAGLKCIETVTPFSLGSGELHPGADPHSTSTGWTGEILLLFLCLHCCSQVLFLP